MEQKELTPEQEKVMDFVKSHPLSNVLAIMRGTGLRLAETVEAIRELYIGCHLTADGGYEYFAVSGDEQ